MSDWDLSVYHSLPVSAQNAAKVLRFVLGEKKGGPLPKWTKTHINSVLLFFSPAPVPKDQTSEEDMSAEASLQLLLLPLRHLSPTGAMSVGGHLHCSELLLCVGGMFQMVPTGLGL
uniref:Uncharacterized protein n=1 Tax=Knipowitschia caucasica TaxID=637954 RepID=A0AAV2KSG6_KNICA